MCVPRWREVFVDPKSATTGQTNTNGTLKNNPRKSRSRHHPNQSNSAAKTLSAKPATGGNNANANQGKTTNKP